MKGYKRVKKISKRLITVCMAVIIVLIILGFSYQSYFDMKMDKRFKPRGEFVNINGRKIHYVKSGDGTPSIIFEPGVQFWSTSWSVIQKETSRFGTTYSYDRGGMGFSDPVNEIAVDTYVDELNLLIEKLSVEPPIIFVGHSFGGTVINAFYNKYPGKVDGVIFIEPGNPDDVLKWAPEVQPIYLKLAQASAHLGLIRLFYRNRLQDKNYDIYHIEEFKHLFAKPKVTQSFVQSLMVLRELTNKSRIDSFNQIPIEIIYTSNFDEVGTSFENEEEREKWKTDYLTYWTSLAAKSSASKDLFLIPDANHNSVVLDTNYASIVSNRVVEMINYIKTN